MILDETEFQGNGAARDASKVQLNGPLNNDCNVTPGSLPMILAGFNPFSGDYWISNTIKSMSSKASG